MAEEAETKPAFATKLFGAVSGRARNGAEERNEPPAGEPASQPDSNRDDALPLRAHVASHVELPIVPAVPKRGWMDETGGGFANRCLPLLMANQWGWFILNNRAIRVARNGRETRFALTAILSGGRGQRRSFSVLMPAALAGA